VVTGRTFLEDTAYYASRIRLFQREDWKVYFAWIGLMLGLLGSVTGFLCFGFLNGVVYPSYVWNVPIGIFIFVGAIAFDTIGHRTAYKQALKKGEDLVHHITIFAGITSIFLLCLAYDHREFLRIPALVMTVLSVFYSVIDEAMHWQRYTSGNSDRIEMWSHFFIFVGHLIMVVSWWHWFENGYPGVAETLRLLPQ
jgi:MFS family permease